MKTLLLIGISISILFISCEEKDIDTEVYGCTDVSAYNYNPDATESADDCLYECPSGSFFLLYTLDNGQSWNRRCSFQDSSSMIIDVTVVDQDNIWICTAYPAKIVHVSNDGQIWDIQYQDDSKTTFFNYIEMFDELNGVAMGDGDNDIPLILHTTNGGMTWDEVASEPIGEASADTWRRIQFIDANIGYFRNCCNQPQLLYKTIDGGETWLATNYSGYVQVLRFYDDNIGLVIEGSGQVHRTMDGGESWESFSTGHSGWGMDIEFSSDNPANIWIVAAEIFYSADTGRTWQLQDDTIRGRNLVVDGERGWLFAPSDLYHSVAADIGDWELTTFELPENSSIIDAIDGDGGLLVVPGYIGQ